MRTRPGQEAVFRSTELDVRSTLCEQPLRWRLIETAPVRALYSLTGDRLRAIEVIDGRDDCCANRLHNDVHGHGDERVVVFGIVIEALHTVLGACRRMQSPSLSNVTSTLMLSRSRRARLAS